jgi:hypothetical protein
MLKAKVRTERQANSTFGMIHTDEALGIELPTGEADCLMRRCYSSKHSTVRPAIRESACIAATA